MQPVTKNMQPKKLWGNPKVFISANELIIEERYYSLAQTHSAYVEPVPVEAPKTGEPPKAPADAWTGFRKTIMIIAGIILFLLIVLFVIWWNDDYSSGSGSRKYRLVLVSNFGTVVALEHHNEKKLKEIANLVNQAVANSSVIGSTAPLR